MAFIVIIKTFQNEEAYYSIFGPIDSEAEAIHFAGRFTYEWRDNSDIEAYVRGINQVPGKIPRCAPFSGLGWLCSTSKAMSEAAEVRDAKVP
jgi:hypothetical protein